MTELSFLSVRFRTTGLHTPSSPFWLDYETKLRGDSQSPSQDQGIHLWGFLGIAYDFVYIVLAPI